MSAASSPDGASRSAGRFSHLSTGAKILILLSLALLPLAIIVFMAALQSIRGGDAELAEFQALTLEDGSRRLGQRLATDLAVIEAAADARPTAQECTRSRALLDAGLGASGFALLPRGTRSFFCGSPPTLRVPAGGLPADGSVVNWIDVEGGQLVFAIGGARSVALVGYPAAAIAAVVRPGIAPAPDFSIVLVRGERRLPLIDESDDGADRRRESVTEPVLNASGLALELRSAVRPIGADALLLMLLPFAMWLLAVVFVWLVVDRLLLRPLYALRRAVAGYQPGTVIDPLAHVRSPAREIRELGETFHAISQTIATHDAAVEEGLRRQTRLTREVHHRVKNNLQVVASLINVHARDAESAEATDAYAAIQRRVDALAVVHRHHFAELEANNGLPLQRLIGELASNLRGGAPAGADATRIVVSVPPLNVVQDVAVPIAFLITELAEHSMTRMPTAEIAVAVWPGDEAGRAELSILSPAFIDDVRADDMPARHRRVLDGLARQLRAPLLHDGTTGRYSIGFPVVA